MRPRITTSAAALTLLVLQTAQIDAYAAVGVAASDTTPDSATVTLVTGDRVFVTAANSRAVSVQPAAGRAGVAFRVEHELSADGKTHTFVTPIDAAPLIASGKLDRALFDVTTLVDSSYDDQRPDLPLIVTYESTQGVLRAPGSTSLGGVAVTHSLRSVNGEALRVPKQQIGNLWNTIAAGATGARSAVATAGTIRKVWLDRLVKPALDQSVPQIGAAAAWAAGYTGAGIVVGLVDTGVDSAHPDLAGKVIAERSFVLDFDPNVSDTIGHGTHVASTIAGTGVASGGKYRGVAPDAQLVSAKACFALGCPFSNVMAAMEWAVTEEGATVINMSLGGADTNDIDPLEETVNRLTAQYDVLFVVAAGNLGPGESTVASPATADAALAVAAVDRSDVTALFSGRGPRSADFGVKPEIAAPGVGIVAARARGTNPGAPVGDAYTTLSGTSMATPHVAGAAALLKQRYPQLSSAQLKGLLMSSAKQIPTMRVYDNGAGRVDVAAALAANMLAEPASLNLGVALWPQQQNVPSTRSVTYTNLSNADVTLALQLLVAKEDGAAPPAGVFTADPATLVVPARGTAVAAVIVNTQLAPAGVYSGRLIATAGGNTSSTPLALHVEPESYDVVVSHVNADGTQASNYDTTFLPLDQRPRRLSRPRSSGVATGDITVRLPPGRYRLGSVIQAADAATPAGTAVFLESFDLRGSMHLALDARTASLVTPLPPSPGATTFFTHAGFDMALGWNPPGGRYRFEVFGNLPQSLRFRTNGGPMPDVLSWISRQWRDAGADSHAPRATLHLATWLDHGALPLGPTKAVDPKRVAVVDSVYGYSDPGFRQALVGVSTVVNDNPSGAIVAPAERPSFPLRRTERYYSNERSVAWTTLQHVFSPDLSRALGSWSTGLQHFEARRRDSDRLGTPPFAPAYGEDGLSAPFRVGNTLILQAFEYSDAEGHLGLLGNNGPVDQSRRFTLFRNGEKIAETRGAALLNTAVPADDAVYRFEASASQAVSALSTRVDAAWTFHSSRLDDATRVVLPLITVGFQPALNASGQALRGGRFRLPLRVTQVSATPNGNPRCRHDVTLAEQGGASGVSCPDSVRSVTVRVSFDDGANWRSVPVERNGERWIAELQHPANAQFVSLQASASDSAGNSFEETVIRAYALTGTAAAAALTGR